MFVKDTELKGFLYFVEKGILQQQQQQQYWPKTIKKKHFVFIELKEQKQRASIYNFQFPISVFLVFWVFFPILNKY